MIGNWFQFLAINMQIKSIENVEIKNKRVLLRTDFNVPLKGNKIQDDFKITRAIPTIKMLLQNGNQIIIVSHLGRPEGKRVKSMSLAPVAKYLSNELKEIKVKFIFDKLSLGLVKRIKSLDDRVILLENMRYEKGEDKNDLKLAKLLSCCADVFVNEAFAACHRTMASMVAITKFLPSYAGLNLAHEYKYLIKSLNPLKPAIAIIGGSKIETKINFIKKLSKIYDAVLIGGGLANTLLSARRYEVGVSLYDKDYIKLAKTLLRLNNVVIPMDVVISDSRMLKARVADVGKNKSLCTKQEKILDIGSKTMKHYSDFIRAAKFIIWNGPMGLFEQKKFSHGTMVIAKAIGARAKGRAIGIAGGGETLYAIDMARSGKYYDFISGGGGAMLEFMEGKVLPGIKPLLIKNNLKT
ncbi:MAG: Phosphoglycerate kinase [Parcubacteria group bacterium GW2011_GWC2_39_14]|nr:MAG: Phosphoglycerate kinase [Parcubacteria group bacterium GW2011_GWC2_39_14]KKR54422.1 MAG: Phosphoglycerate kinase [Parcubacteria group bacterium GW2011_GWA2_40_23]